METPRRARRLVEAFYSTEVENAGKSAFPSLAKAPSSGLLNLFNKFHVAGHVYGSNGPPLREREHVLQ